MGTLMVNEIGSYGKNIWLFYVYIYIYTCIYIYTQILWYYWSVIPINIPQLFFAFYG